MEIARPSVPVVSNVLARAVDEPEAIRKLLVEQVIGAVRWRASVVWMAGQGVSEMWELGAGKALSGMIRRIDKTVATRPVGTSAEVKAAAEDHKGGV